MHWAGRVREEILNRCGCVSLFFPLFKECYEEGLLHVITTFYDELRGDRLQVLFLKISKFKRIINYYSLVKPSENCRCRSTVEVLSEVLVINDVTQSTTYRRRSFVFVLQLVRFLWSFSYGTLSESLNSKPSNNSLERYLRFYETFYIIATADGLVICDVTIQS